MANLLKLNAPEGWVAGLSTSLNSLASGSSALTSNVANGTDFYPKAEISGQLASFTPGTGGWVEIHIAKLLADGTTYEDVYAGGPTSVGVIQLLSGASAKNFGETDIDLPPCDFKWCFINVGGAALASSGNVFKFQRYAINLNG